MLTLVLGGAASGKSEYAEALVLRSALPRYYLATMQVRPQGRTLFLFHRDWVYVKPHHRNSL